MNSSSHLPSRGVRIAIAFLLLAALLVRIFSSSISATLPVIDYSIINIVSLLLCFLAVQVLLLWFSFYSGRSPRVRYGVLAGAIGAAILGAAALRIEGVDGDLLPRIVPRWQRSADARLGRIEPPASGLATDSPARALREQDGPEAEFPQFLGPDRNNYLSGPTLATDWQANPPKQLWRQPIGAGWSAFAATGGRAVTMEQRGEEEWVACYDLETGRPLWGHAITARHETKLGGIGPRATPTIHGERVYALGATGVVRCLELATGRLIWQDDLLARYRVMPEQEKISVAWGRANSPLILDDVLNGLVVLPAGGNKPDTHSLIAYRQETGEVAWQGGGQQISYASPVDATLCGVRQIVTVNESSVAGHDPKSGEELWQFPWDGFSGGNASASQSHVFAGDRVFISKGYGGGAAVWQIARDGDQWTASEIWHNPAVLRTKFTNVVILEGNAYGLSDGILECVDLSTGDARWKKGRYGHGQVLGVGRLLLVQSEPGPVALVSASPEKYIELARFPALDSNTWANPTLCGRRLLVRSSTEAACYELP